MNCKALYEGINYNMKGNAFGISIQISGVKKISPEKYVFVVKDNNDCEYILKSKYVPSDYSISIYSPEIDKQN